MKKLVILIAVFVALATLIFAQEQPREEPKAADVTYARLSFVGGTIFLQRASDLGYEDAVLNTPIAEGDRLGTADGRAEVHLGGRNFVRLDENSKIDFQILPRKDSSLVRLRPWSGSLYLDLNTLDMEKGVEILTSDASFYILDEGLYRIDLVENGRTEILVFNGMVEVAGEDGSILVKREQRLAVSGGRFEGRPSSFFATAEDAFDRWNGERATAARRSYARRYVPDELEAYQAELDEHGDWVEMDSYGPVWVPRGLGADWRPYSYGRWTWLPRAGWCWIPYESWGWSTSHYGRWHWDLGWGWYWIPMSGWGPAWVNWWWNDYYYGWAPLSYWGYPGVIFNNVYYGRGWSGDYPHDSRALTVVHKNQLQAPDVRKASLSSDSIRSLGGISLSQRSLDLRPEPSRTLRLDPLDGNRGTILRKDGPAELTRPIEPRSLGRDAGATGAVARPAGEAPPASRAIRTTGRIESAPPSMPPANRPIGERKIFPPSSRITRDSAAPRISSTGSALDRFYQYFKGERTAGPSRSTGSTGRNTTVSPNRTSAPRSSSPPPSSRGGASSGGSRPTGTIRKK